MSDIGEKYAKIAAMLAVPGVYLLRCWREDHVRQWTTKEARTVSTVSARDAARLTGRTVRAIRQFRWRNGISTTAPRYSDAEIARMREMRESGFTWAQIGAEIGRTDGAARRKWVLVK